jgi:hypothetical protein
MSISDAQFHAWLSDPSAARVALIEVVVNTGGVETTRYLSTRPFVTNPTDTPANQLYLPIASTGIQFTEQLSLTADGSMSAGDIEINNVNGERDVWLNDIWDNRQVQAFIGDARWARTDFRMIFNGIVATIAVGAREKLNLKIRDKLQQLNTPLIETLLGGTTPNKAALLPLLFGEAHNISPLLTDPTTLTYQVHNVAVENIFEVRDNGLPVSVTLDNVHGKFQLNQSAFGAITVSAQGDKGDGTYHNTVSSIIQRLVTGYGKASQRFTTADLDTANLSAFDTAHPDPVGVPFPDRTNVLVACQMLASSIGAQMVMSRLGLLRLLQITLPPPGTPTVIQPTQMVERSLVVQAMPPVQAAFTLGFCKNWTVQPDLVTTIPQQVKDLYAQEWLQSVQVDTTVQATYRQDAAPVQKDTMLLRRTECDAEATRLTNLWKVQRKVYQFEGTADLLDTLVLGQAVTIFNHRYGLQGGVTGMVISLAPNWLTARVIVQVLA